MRIIVTLLFLICGMLALGTTMQKGFDRAAFYSVMAADNLDSVNRQIKLLEKSSVAGRDAFYGTLLMKKAGLVVNPAKKLNLFKAGHKKLEPAINKDSSNAEFRFLRLMIQENAPKILGYDKELEKDSEFITRHFKTLPAAVQKAINDYSKRSKILKPALL